MKVEARKRIYGICFRANPKDWLGRAETERGKPFMLSGEASARELRNALHRLLHANPDPFVVDVGANDGDFIIGLTESLPISGLSIEPGPNAFSRLLQRLEPWPKIRAVCVAIADEEGSALLNVAESDVGSSLLTPMADPSSRWARTESQITVPTTRLDCLLEGEHRVVSLLKVDAEGTDLSVLMSAGSMLEPGQVGAVLVEVKFHQFYKGQDSFSDVLKLMDERGYFLAELFRYYNRKGWLWYADALFLPRSEAYAT